MRKKLLGLLFILLFILLMVVMFSGQAWAFDLNKFLDDSTFICNVDLNTDSGSIFLDTLFFTTESEEGTEEFVIYTDIENYYGIGWEYVLGIEQIADTTTQLRYPIEFSISTSQGQYIFSNISKECSFDGTEEDEIGSYVYRDTCLTLSEEVHFEMLVNLVDDQTDGKAVKYGIKWDNGNVDRGFISYDPISDFQKSYQSYASAGGFKQGLEKYDFGYKFMISSQVSEGKRWWI